MDQNQILNSSFERIKKYLEENKNIDKPVVRYKSPLELAELVNLPVSEQPVSQEEFIGLIDQYLEFSVRTGNKQFLNQLYSGFNFPAFIGEVFTTLANTSMYTYEVAPMAAVIEKEMVALMNSYIGYEAGDGIFVSGGSNANLVAMFSARNRVSPDSRFTGNDHSQKLRVFVNEQAHYSFETAANLLGLGSKSVIKVKADSSGRMIPEELEKELKASVERGEKPFFVAATCATTLLGAYDPIDEISKIVSKYDVWLHADGSFGGSLILSDKYRGLMRGIEKTDSFTWNPHKLMNIPLICSALLVRKRDTLYQNITDINTDYIFHDIDAVEDLGKKSIQCGRRVDAVKLWFAWKYYGQAGYRNRIDHSFEMAQYAEFLVQGNPKLEILADRQSFTVCFRYVPSYEIDLNEFNLALRESLRKSGISLVNYGYMGEKLVIRLVIANAEIQESDIDQFFANLIFTAEELESNWAG